jgi:integrase
MPTLKLTDRAVAAASAPKGRRVELWDEATPGLCVRVNEKGGKVFVLRYRTDDGRQPRHKLGEYSPSFGVAEARRAAEKLRVQIRDGADPAGERKRRRHEARSEPIKTFNELADTFLAASESGAWRPRGKKKRERTIADETGILGRHIRPAIGALRLEEVDRNTIRNFLRAMAAKGIGAQVNRAHAVTRQVLAYGVAEERLASNPAAGLAPVAHEKPRNRVLTDAELRALWAALKAPAGLKKPVRKGAAERKQIYVGRPLAIAVQLCVLLLQRRNEVAGMTVEELDLETGVWTIPADRMKGGRPHVVPLPGEAVKLINEALELAKAGRKKAPAVVFPSSRDAEKSIRPDSVTHVMRDAMAALDLPNASPHDLRRTGATALVGERLGFAPFIVSRVLAHSSDMGGAAAVTLAHYALHDFGGEKRRALEAWEKLLLEVVGERPRASNIRDLRRARAG